MSVDSTALERSALERKDRDELLTIAKALGGKPTARAKKADIVDLVLQLTGVEGDDASTAAPEAATATAEAEVAEAPRRAPRTRKAAAEPTPERPEDEPPAEWEAEVGAPEEDAAPAEAERAPGGRQGRGGQNGQQGRQERQPARQGNGGEPPAATAATTATATWQRRQRQRRQRQRERRRPSAEWVRCRAGPERWPRRRGRGRQPSSSTARPQPRSRGRRAPGPGRGTRGVHGRAHRRRGLPGPPRRGLRVPADPGLPPVA